MKCVIDSTIGSFSARMRFFEKDRHCPVLAYHKVNDFHSRDPYSVRVKDFEYHMRYFSMKGYNCLSLEKYLKYLISRKRFPSRSFVLTFDDGYEDFYLNVLPVLMKYKFTATVFLVAGLIGKENEWDKQKGYSACRLMDWARIKKVMKAGMDIGSHAFTHSDLVYCENDSLIFEIKESKRILEQEIKKGINFFSYPYGSFNDKVIAEVIRSKYIGACATGGNFYNGRYAIKRISVLAPAAFSKEESRYEKTTFTKEYSVRRSQEA